MLKHEVRVIMTFSIIRIEIIKVNVIIVKKIIPYNHLAIQST